MESGVLLRLFAVAPLVAAPAVLVVVARIVIVVVDGDDTRHSPMGLGGEYRFHRWQRGLRERANSSLCHVSWLWLVVVCGDYLGCFFQLRTL